MPRGKYYMKGRIIIIQISKEEAHILNKKYGVRFGDGISTSHTRHKKYYLCVGHRMALNEIRGIKSKNQLKRENRDFRNKRVGV